MSASARVTIILSFVLLGAASLAGCGADPGAAAADGPASADGTAASDSARLSPNAADSAAIMAAMSNWESGWEAYDADLSSRDYSDDADWTNAFGTRLSGRDSIRTFLTRAFTRPALTAGRTEYEYHALRFLAPDVALLRSRAIREGQQLADGSSPPRHINHLRVFVKRQGTWQIVSHLIGDERTPGQPR